MKLEDIGFYTLNDERAQNVTVATPLQRCEILLTDKCNFSCPYCRGIREDCAGTIPFEKVTEIVDMWAEHNIQNIRFSGGEPTVYKRLPELISYTKSKGLKHIAISTNGSAPFEMYKDLAERGVNDFSISLDACCASFGDKMSGVQNSWTKVIENIKKLSEITYVTTGIVLTEETVHTAKSVVQFAHDLGVADIRVISSAQYNESVEGMSQISEEILNIHPILKYRVNNFKNQRDMRGLKDTDSNACPLVLDDMAVAGNYHFPCIIYLREGGNPIGEISKNMRNERYEWYKKTNTQLDPICKKNCLDVCIDYNNQVKKLQKLPDN